jgi:hypothetical protein
MCFGGFLVKGVRLCVFAKKKGRNFGKNAKFHPFYEFTNDLIFELFLELIFPVQMRPKL